MSGAELLKSESLRDKAFRKESGDSCSGEIIQQNDKEKSEKFYSDFFRCIKYSLGSSGDPRKAIGVITIHLFRPPLVSTY